MDAVKTRITVLFAHFFYRFTVVGGVYWKDRDKIRVVLS